MDKINLITNLIIGISVLIGFFGYFARIAGWYEEGGLFNKFWKLIKEKIHHQKDDSQKNIK